MSETEAIEGAKQGREECFEPLYCFHKKRVYSLCLRMTGNTDEAEDLTQEAFLQLYRKISTFRGDSAFSTWLHRLTVNVVLMHLRKNGLRMVSIDETLDSIEEDGQKNEFGCADQVLAGSVDRLVLERAIENLPPGYRITFVLHDIEGYEHLEIAEIMGCSIGNSKSQLHKARLTLRDQLTINRDDRGPKPNLTNRRSRYQSTSLRAEHTGLSGITKHEERQSVTRDTSQGCRLGRPG